MSKNIQTHNAKIDLVKKFLDYANIADASYALLEYTNDEYVIRKNSDGTKDISDGQKLGSTYNNQNSTYARAIEARFEQDTIGKKYNNDITQVKLDSKLSKRTLDFTNRFRILAHQENTDSGFSATLFEDMQDSNQKIFAIRGTEFPSGFFDDVLDADKDLALGKLASNQYIDMIKFYEDCVQKGCITDFTPLTITGHSLGGCLAQLLTLSLATSANANNVKEVYTFNSPGAKNLEINDNNLGGVYEIDSTILTARDKERALFKKIRGYEYEGNSNLLRDSTLIGYDSSLFNEIYKYFANTENLKEHSILVRTFAMSNTRYIGKSMISSVIYTYKIFSINETFIKCLNTLKTNNLSKQPLACQDSIHHIKTDEDSNPDNNLYIKMPFNI